MITYPKNLKEIIDSSPEADSKLSEMGWDGTVLRALSREFILNDSPYHEKYYNGLDIDSDKEGSYRFHYESFRKRETNFLDVMSVQIPDFIHKFSKGDDTSRLEDVLLPLATGFSTQALKKFMIEKKRVRTFDEKGLIDYFKEKRIMLHKMYLESSTGSFSPFEEGTEYIVPGAITFPDRSSMCWHMYIEKTRKGTVLNVAEHLVHGQSGYNQNWDSIRNHLNNFALGFDGTGNVGYGVFVGLETLEPVQVDPKKDDSWRPGV